MQTIIYVVLLLGAVFCAWRAMRAKRLLSAALYLACVSGFVAVTLYLLGAHEVAVIELSVGAGLVTVLLVYALSVVGEDALDPASVVPKPLAFAAVAACVLVLAWLALPSSATQPASTAIETANLSASLWQQRALDVWVQIALIFAGVLGVLGLLSEKSPDAHPEAR